MAIRRCGVLAPARARGPQGAAADPGEEALSDNSSWRRARSPRNGAG
ncbi:hypothetical protein SLNWT_3753 [Streptomyces albus]|uniref:Uncharacterized protein n=1 Tax=Streptomyces albus (strain ATCC 21838 / DSM 41398 / FERM P-419 / JCM 4703 / NBRC 107858) TaxID=1081613 RepID=A0A0B5ER86_STRA4|nr:hypothetical protein SLNWT_3753 [Streptomyces albus]AOU78434.1 hypothetical protein SLNHY_3743 [Streptomyces albus]AYN34182.1 hypothetical protein DUI70_3681 [Streptomyces albus]